MAPYRSCQGAFHRPAIVEEAVDQSGSAQAQLSRPLTNVLRSPPKGNRAVVALVVCLLLACRPATVFRRVRPVVIDALYRHVIGWPTHVIAEVLIRVKPAITDNNSASAVPGIVATRRVAAPLPYIHPDVVWLRACFAMRGEARAATALETQPGKAGSRCVTLPNPARLVALWANLFNRYIGHVTAPICDLVQAARCSIHHVASSILPLKTVCEGEL